MAYAKILCSGRLTADNTPKWRNSLIENDFQKSVDYQEISSTIDSTPTVKINNYKMKNLNNDLRFF